ncbi:MAG: beta-hydroxyacyl-ACP dehydratase [Bacteroidales bacterium]|nr:beta-hydroxyacyl-ACP dehydratase [Bacteroidales bacterium]
MDKPLYKGEEIKKLLNQRAPILMVDTLYEVSDNGATTGLTIEADNFFNLDGQFTEPGLIEHMAQSASAFVGYNAIKSNSSAAPVGYIGEIKNFKLAGRLPKAGDKLLTTVTVQSVVMNITLFTAETKTGDTTVASCQMKLSV